MNPVFADDLLPFELAALMHFYAESGVAWLSEEEPRDRMGESAAAVAAPVAAPPVPGRGDASFRVQTERPGQQVGARSAPVAPAVAVPDAEAVEAARALAAGASTAEALISALEGFAGCNLRFSARHTVFAGGNLAGRVLVVGSVPSAEDDREGKPFSGAAGRILERMMVGIGIGAEDRALVNTIPWRPPGNRAPTVREVEICAPFARRMIELISPQAVLVLGNLAVRILSDDPKATIHGVRGKWYDLPAGARIFRGFATFHPEELVATPMSKRLAWQDLLQFRAGIDAQGAITSQDP